MTIRILRLGSERRADEGLRIGTVRRPPRGVPKSEYSRKNIYDLWFPNLAPSEALLKQFFHITGICGCNMHCYVPSKGSKFSYTR